MEASNQKEFASMIHFAYSDGHEWHVVYRSPRGHLCSVASGFPGKEAADAHASDLNRASRADARADRHHRADRRNAHIPRYYFGR